MLGFEEFTRIALGLPGAHEEITWGEHTFRAGEKIFAMGGPGAADEGGAGPYVSVKASREEQSALIADDPGVYSVAPYVGRFGWVRVALDKADPQEVAELTAEAWRRTAPKRAVRAYDEAAGAGAAGSGPGGRTSRSGARSAETGGA